MTMSTTCLIAVMVRRLMSKHPPRMSEDELGANSGSCGSHVTRYRHRRAGKQYTSYSLAFPEVLASLGYLTTEVCKRSSNHMQCFHLKLPEAVCSSVTRVTEKLSYLQKFHETGITGKDDQRGTTFPNIRINCKHIMQTT